MNELIDLLKDKSGVEVLCILFTVYVAGKWLITQISSIKTWYNDRLKSYHSTENAKEEKEDETEERFKAIEEKLNTDYIRIQKSESHLFEMKEELKEIHDKFDSMNSMLVKLRLETMRGRILDFAPLAIDLTHPQSKERYTEIYKVHADYVKLINETGEENNYETYNFELIKKSFEQRSINKMFTEDCYIPPSTKPNIISEESLND